MKLYDLMDPTLLAEMLEQGFIRERRHTTLPYRILGYTEEAQYSRTWNAVTTQCRGLVVDDDDNVIARPFTKFFNDGEHDGDRLPALDLSAPAEVTDKLDGSLGILVPTPDGHIVSTRGSFESEQAAWATKLYRSTYASRFSPQDGTTYLFEIIYKANRIVVDYDFEDLVLLGAVDNLTGQVSPAAAIDWPGRKAAQFPHHTLAEALAAPVRDNAEGFVIRFLDSDLMVKIKLERYLQLHKIITGLSEKSVWEHLSAGLPLMDLLAELPDEFHQWVTDVRDNLYADYTRIDSAARESFKAITEALEDLTDRKQFAMQALKLAPDMRPLMFLLYDGNAAKLDAAIWRTLKPVGETAMLDQVDAA